MGAECSVYLELCLLYYQFLIIAPAHRVDASAAPRCWLRRRRRRIGKYERYYTENENGSLTAEEVSYSFSVHTSRWKGLSAPSAPGPVFPDLDNKLHCHPANNTILHSDKLNYREGWSKSSRWVIVRRNKDRYSSRFHPRNMGYNLPRLERVRAENTASQL